MKRREFIGNSGKALALGTVFPGMNLTAMNQNSAIGALLAANQGVNDNVLIIIQLNGGNDGLNTLIPLDQYTNLSNSRGNILIPEAKVLKLNNTSKTGIHPSMTGVQSLFNDGKVNFVQSVGYKNQNFSHFRSTDIWLSGSESNTVERTGWMGRFLDHEFPNYPDAYPSTEMPHPLGIQIGSLVSPGFMGPNSPMAVAIANDRDFYNLINDSFPQEPNDNPIGKELNYIRDMIEKANKYNKVIKAAAAAVTQQATYPLRNSLGDQLKIVARLIKGGLKTKIYYVSQGGYDTHAGQVDPLDTTKGTHADLLASLSDAIFAFQNDLKFLGIEDKVLGMTFSEFGRRINSNGSVGTDHGSSLPMVFFGSQVQNGIIGTNPEIKAAITGADNLPMQYDFKSVYASVLEQWFCLDPATLKKILLNDYQSLPIIKKSACSTSSIEDYQKTLEQKRLHCYPNPFVDKVQMEVQSKGGHCILQIFDTEGRMIANVAEGNLPEGQHAFQWDSEFLPTGFYYCRFQNEDYQNVFTLQKVR
jgi:uncharacterized protein (DUF1501 family)